MAGLTSSAARERAFDRTGKRVCIITAGHLSTCPRMLKAADTLAAIGYRVRVVSTRHVDWAAEADMQVRADRGHAWEWSVVDYDRRTAYATAARTSIRRRIALGAVRAAGTTRAPLALVARAYSRVHPELVQAALAAPADLYYAGTNGALAAAAAAARHAGVSYGLDLEDYHTGELAPSPSAKQQHALAERIERSLLSRASFLTVGSASIADAYVRKYGVRPIIINNTFRLPDQAPDFGRAPNARVRIYWFSQTVGPDRGLEEAIVAAGIAGSGVDLHLRGRVALSYQRDLEQLAAERAPNLRLHFHPPIPPDELVDAARDYDIGLAVEPGVSENNSYALSNKVFTYLLAGLAVVLTDTPGQLTLARDLGDGAIVYTSGDHQALAAALRRWADDPAALLRARRTSWDAARRRWHWGHAAESGALVAAVDAAMRS